MKNSRLKNSVTRSIAVIVMLGMSCGQLSALTLQEAKERAQGGFQQAKSYAGRLFGRKQKTSMPKDLEMAQDIEGNPWFVAAKNGDVEVINSLVNQGQSVDEQNKNGFTALHIAVSNGHANAVTALLEHGADADAIVNGLTPLHLAAVLGLTDIATSLLAQPKINIDAQDGEGNTPLHLAAYAGHRQVVDLLINNNADTKLANKHNESADQIVKTLKSRSISARVKRVLKMAALGYVIVVLVWIATSAVLVRLGIPQKLVSHAFEKMRQDMHRKGRRFIWEL